MEENIITEAKEFIELQRKLNKDKIVDKINKQNPKTQIIQLHYYSRTLSLVYII